MVSINIEQISNGLLVSITSKPTAEDPLAQRGPNLRLYAKDLAEAGGVIQDVLVKLANSPAADWPQKQVANPQQLSSRPNKPRRSDIMDRVGE